MRILALALITAAFSYAQSPCDQLKSLSIPDATFSVVETVAAGLYKAPAQAADGGGIAPARAGAAAPGRGGPQQSTLVLPAYCRVAATLKPSPDSDIRMKVWMPAENWNGKIEVV